MRYLYLLPSSVSELRQVHAVYCEVMDSAALRYLLRTLLAVGNFLNYHRRPQGRAGWPGFSVESVLKARDVKSTDGRSLLHVIAFALARDAPHHLRAVAEMAPKLQAAVACEYSVNHSQVIDFAPLWLAYRNSGADGAPPLPPQTPPPPPQPHMSGSSGRGRGTGSGGVSPSTSGSGGGWRGAQGHHPGAAEASSSPSSHAASTLSGLSGGGDVMLVSAELSCCLLSSLSLSLSLSPVLVLPRSLCLSLFCAPLSFSLSHSRPPLSGARALYLADPLATHTALVERAVRPHHEGAGSAAGSARALRLLHPKVSFGFLTDLSF